MSSNKTNDSFQKVENENSINIKNEEEEALIIKYIEEIKNEETRSQAIENLYRYKGENSNLAIYLWYSGGTMAAFLQEIIYTYQYLTTPKFTNEKLNKAKYIISLIQEIALHPKTRKEFLDSQMLVFLYPFLRCSSKIKSYDVIRVTSLGVIAALVKINDSDVINFLIKTEIIPIILRNMEKGTEIIRSTASFIIQRIIDDINGLKYMCDLRERLYVILTVLNSAMQNKPSNRIIKDVLKIYLVLIENKEAKSLIRQYFPKKLRDRNYISTLDESAQKKVESLLKSLKEDDEGTDIKIIKLKNDLTNNNTTIIQNINIIKNNNINIYNNGNQINLNNNDMNNNNKNLNMIFANNMNQMKLPSMMHSQINDYKYNIYNNDNEGFINPNIYNQNTGNGFPNINYYNNYKNV
jgi:CCR4-NOT transcription complex subunit 9